MDTFLYDAPKLKDRTLGYKKITFKILICFFSDLLVILNGTETKSSSRKRPERSGEIKIKVSNNK